MANTLISDKIIARAGRLVRVQQFADETGRQDSYEDDIGEVPPGQDVPDGTVVAGGDTGAIPDQPAAPGGSASTPPVARAAQSDMAAPSFAGYGQGPYRFGNVGGGAGMPPSYGAQGGGYQGFGGMGSTPYQFGNIGNSPAMPGTGPRPNYQFGNIGGAGMAEQTPYNQPTTSAQRVANQMQAPQAGQPGTDAGQMKNSFLYNWDNPAAALDMAMRSSGINPFKAGNPFVQMIRNAAPGLALAFQMSHVGDADTNSLLGSGGFGDYLRNALSSGSVFSSLANAASALPGLTQSLTSQYDQNPMGINSVAQGLLGLLESNAGAGATGALYNLLAPMMAGSQQRGYREGLQGGLGNAQYNFAQQPNFTSSIFDYLFGGQGGGTSRPTGMAGGGM